MMSGMLAVAGMGRMTGAITGGFLWVWHGATAVALLSAFLCALAAWALATGLRTTPDRRRQPD
jgi:predicted MFS family arabinose efflux permease